LFLSSFIINFCEYLWLKQQSMIYKDQIPDFFKMYFVHYTSKCTSSSCHNKYADQFLVNIFNVTEIHFCFTL
jgi:hypothetical protein